MALPLPAMEESLGSSQCCPHACSSLEQAARRSLSRVYCPETRHSDNPPVETLHPGIILPWPEDGKASPSSSNKPKRDQFLRKRSCASPRNKWNNSETGKGSP